MFREEKETNKNRFVIFQDVRKTLRKNASERTPESLEDLRYYFRNNPYFIEYERDNGLEGLMMIYKAMKFQVSFMTVRIR